MIPPFGMGFLPGLEEERDWGRLCIYDFPFWGASLSLHLLDHIVF